MEPIATRIQELFRTADALLSRPDLAAFISPESAGQLVHIRNFARSWEEHSLHLSDEQQTQCLGQLTGAVNELTRTVAEFDQARLKTTPVEQMAKA